MHDIVRKINDNLLVCEMEEFYYEWYEETNITYIDDVINDCVKYSTDNATIIGIMVKESDHYSQWIGRVQNFYNKLKLNKRKFLLVINSWHNIPSQQFRILYLDYYIIAVWFESVGRKKSIGYKKEWDNTADKFLFLTGKPNKTQRIGLLYKMYKADLLKNALWSLFVPTDEVYIETRTYLNKLTDIEYDKFIKDHIISPDIVIDHKNIDKNALIHFGRTTPKDIPHVLLEVVSEGSFESSKPSVIHISEKIWKPIMNNTPFIVAGDTGYLNKLEQRGYKTFKKYLKYPQYNDIADLESKMNMIVQNIKYWFDDKTYIKFETEIRNDIQHNFEQYNKDVQKNLDILNNLNNKFGLDNYTPYDLISYYEEYRKNEWLIFYDSIKDESWPPCVYEDEFEFLPRNIQNECIEIFGYNPREPISLL